jgi:hypothetical protein
MFDAGHRAGVSEKASQLDKSQRLRLEVRLRSEGD